MATPSPARTRCGGPGSTPWRIVVEGERIYGRGTADNKGQHSVNLAALAAVLEERGALGFNCKVLIEMAEEVGSAGLRELCAHHRDGLLKADVLIGSDGPRIAPERADDFPRRARRLSDRSDRRLARRRHIIPAIGAG